MEEEEGEEEEAQRVGEWRRRIMLRRMRRRDRLPSAARRLIERRPGERPWETWSREARERGVFRFLEAKSQSRSCRPAGSSLKGATDGRPFDDRQFFLFLLALLLLNYSEKGLRNKKDFSC